MYRDRALYVCESAQEQKTDDFRCLITVWSIRIARRGLNELVFVKTSNSTNLVLFLAEAQNEPVHVHTHSASITHISAHKRASGDEALYLCYDGQDSHHRNNPAIVCEEKLMTWNITNSFWSQSTFTSIIAFIQYRWFQSSFKGK